MRRFLCWIALLACFASPAFAQVSISNLPQASALVGTEPVPVVQNGQTRKATVAAIGSPRGFIDGFTLATAGSSIQFTVAPGQATDASGVYKIALASTLTKTTAAWAQGVGGCLDTGAIANSTWYNIFAIENVSTGVVDALCSTSLTPTMPSGWTAQRRIGSMLTNSSGQWTGFFQIGDEFYWTSIPVDLTSGACSTTPALQSLTVAPGVTVTAHINVQLSSSASALINISIFSPMVSSFNSNTLVNNVGSGTFVAGSADVPTNTSRQVRYICNVTTGQVFIQTLGWRDTRGRNS